MKFRPYPHTRDYHFRIGLGDAIKSMHTRRGWYNRGCHVTLARKIRHIWIFYIWETLSLHNVTNLVFSSKPSRSTPKYLIIISREASRTLLLLFSYRQRASEKKGYVTLSTESTIIIINRNVAWLRPVREQYRVRRFRAKKMPDISE